MDRHPASEAFKAVSRGQANLIPKTQTSGLHTAQCSVVAAMAIVAPFTAHRALTRRIVVQRAALQISKVYVKFSRRRLIWDEFFHPTIRMDVRGRDVLNLNQFNAPPQISIFRHPASDISFRISPLGGRHHHQPDLNIKIRCFAVRRATLRAPHQNFFLPAARGT
ncbi:hypothetical protein R3P38DRAFT_2804810 [Favolaschia claudopus]|uniref:Uncharacterized protein n=1 Tax=Favolaschia claudopus TaxID=2862362 RepID=A0AAV9ZNT3_9AGAR